MRTATHPIEPTEASTSTSGAEGSRDSVRRFFLSTEAGETAAGPLEPAALTALLLADPPWTHYPLLITTPQEVRPLSAVVTAALRETNGDAGAPKGPLVEQLPRLMRAAARALEGASAPRPLHDVIAEARRAFADEFDVSEAGAQELEAQLGRAVAKLPDQGALIGLGESTLPVLHAAVALAEHRGRAEAFAGRVRSLVQRLDEQLRVDRMHGPEGASATSLAATLGSVGGNRLDPEALSRTLPAHRGGARMSDGRRARIEQARAVLRRYLDDPPSAVVVVADALAAYVAPEGVEVVREAQPLASAAGRFDAQAARMAEVVRAVRLAELELAGAYDEERHGFALERLGWRWFGDAERAVVPPVVVVEAAERARGAQMGAFSDLLLSDRGVQVLLVDRLQSDAPAPQQAHHPGVGYLAIAHRECFVMQSTLGRPAHLAAGLLRMARFAGPAVAVVACPRPDAPASPWSQLLAALAGRATPCFVYDPDAGATWAERFDLAANPEPDRAFPGADEPFTFAHAAAIDPAWRAGYRVVPEDAFSDEQVEIGDYLAQDDDGQVPRIPYLWTVSAGGARERAIVRNDVVLACRDRMRMWRTLQELGGMSNEHVRRAVEAARAEADAEAARVRDELAAEHAAEVERVRAEAAGEAMQRVVDVLMGIDLAAPRTAASAGSAAPAVAAAAPTPAATPGAPEAAAEPDPAPQTAPEEDDEDVSFDDPYIDSVLCTTCNECTNLNGQMFAYNDDKQATLADPRAGSFKELVMAAEKCPARCIHPGAPRPDDPTATPDLVARAAKFR